MQVKLSKNAKLPTATNFNNKKGIVMRKCRKAHRLGYVNIDDVVVVDLTEAVYKPSSLSDNLKYASSASVRQTH